MDEEKKKVCPIISEYQGKPIIRIPTVENPNPDTTWHWLITWAIRRILFMCVCFGLF
jgi:hypothetical protein